MNIREQIIADITAKVETKLASQKVELANINDFTKIVNDAKNKLKKFNDDYAQLEKLIAPIIKSGNDYIDALDKGVEMNNLLSKDFKQLGLDWSTYAEAKAFKDVFIKGDRGVVSTMVATIKNI
jgi:hypothetical protein